MAMSISSAQMMPQVATVESATVPTRSTRTAIPADTPVSVPAATPAVESPAESPASAPTVSSPAQLSTDREVDSRHQIYYEFVDESTGNIVFEIPPEALRAIGESLNLPRVGDASSHSVDVES